MHERGHERERQRAPHEPGAHITIKVPPPASDARPRLLDAVRERIRYRHYSYRTEQAYVEWVRRFVRFHDRRHPRDMGAREIEAFLSHLANERDVAASTHNQALSALLFLYGEVLGIELPWLGEIERPRRPQRLPVVLTREEVRDVLALLEGVSGLMARLLYGTGMRLMECVRLRVKDLDLARSEILVRQGKGGKDRVTMVPRALVPELHIQLARARFLWQADRAANVPGVELPHALAAKYPQASTSWAGSGCSRPTSIHVIRAPAPSGGTMSTRNHCSERFGARSVPRESPSTRRRTRCVTRSPRTCSNPATT